MALIRRLLKKGGKPPLPQSANRQEELSVREGVINDLPALAELYALAGAKISGNSRKPAKAEQQGDCFCLVVENKNGELVGFAQGKTYQREGLPACSGELYRLYLRSGYEGMGLEQQLIAASARKILSIPA